MACTCPPKTRAAAGRLLAAAAAAAGPSSPRHAVHLQVFRGLARAHASGALGDVAGGGGLGELVPGDWFPSRTDIDAETERFDAQLNAWLLDYSTTANRLPAAVVQQVDAFVTRWRDLRASFYVVQKFRADEIFNAEAEWNRLRDQVDSLGVSSAITPATVTLSDGSRVRADKIPPGLSTLDRVESIAKWAAIIVAGAAAYKIASDLGAFKKLGGLFGRAARASNPRRPSAREFPDDVCEALIDRDGHTSRFDGSPCKALRSSARHSPCAGKSCSVCKGSKDARLCHPFSQKKRNPRRRRRAA
jgi:hypothetical protein